MKNIRVITSIFLGLFVVVVVTILLSRDQQKESLHINSINSFQECVKAGYPVMESYPRQCMVPNGSSFTEQEILQECSKIQDCPEKTACINHVCQKLTK